MISKLIQFPWILRMKIHVSTFAWAKTWEDSALIVQRAEPFSKFKLYPKYRTGYGDFPRIGRGYGPYRREYEKYRTLGL